MIKQPYLNVGRECHGILYGHGDAVHKKRDISKLTFLCLPVSSGELKPEQYKFYKIVNREPVEVPQTRNFYTGKRNIDSKYYVAENIN